MGGPRFVSAVARQRLDGGGDRAEIFGELLRETQPFGRRAVELARPGLAGVPLAREMALLLQSSKQGVQRVGVGLEPATLELLKQSIAVARLHQQSQTGEDNR